MEIENHRSELDKLQKVWQTLAQDDPMWAILSDPEKRGRKWNRNEFFETGTREIRALFQTLEKHDIRYATRAALDFGCGLGRLTQALAPYFETAYGVDISAEMIQRAAEMNAYGNRCRYVLNTAEDLRQFSNAQFSFIYSMIVLQHIPPPLSESYLREFFRVLEPNGLLIFQLPSVPVSQATVREEGWSASIQLPQSKLVVPTGTRYRLPVTVHNTSSLAWERKPGSIIALGNHWLTSEGAIIRLDDGRTILQATVQPGEAVELVLEIIVPQIPGYYVLELDLVEEGVSWFGPKGSRTTRLVVEAHDSNSPTQEPPLATMTTNIRQQSRATENLGHVAECFSMYCIPRARVLEVMRRADGYLEYIHPTDCAPGFLSYFYFARKISNCG
jgi:SAM-dependent methyltransferase